MTQKDIIIFEKPEDYMNWEKLSHHCEGLDGLTDFEKERAKRAFQFLKAELGDKFLGEAFHEGHPICKYIQNLAPWTRKWITWLADAIKELKESENYLSLLNRIKDKNRFSEGLSVLEIAYKFSKVGFKIIIDPPMDISGKIKIPDLKIVNQDSKEDLFVEVSMLGESVSEKEAWETMRRITESLWKTVPFMHYCGRIHKALAERHLDDIVRKVEKTVERVRKDNAFHELIAEDIVEIGIAPENDKEILQKWAGGKGLKVGEFHGPSYDVDEILRTKGKVDREQNQLPRGYPNIAIVMNYNLFFHAKDIRKTISELEECVYKYPHILAVVIAGRNIGTGENEIIMKDQHVYIRKTRTDLHVEQYVILLNQFCDFKISPATITKMYNAFRTY